MMIQQKKIYYDMSISKCRLKFENEMENESCKKKKKTRAGTNTVNKNK